MECFSPPRLPTRVQTWCRRHIRLFRGAGIRADNQLDQRVYNYLPSLAEPTEPEGVQLSPVSGRQPAEPEGVQLSPVSGRQPAEPEGVQLSPVSGRQPTEPEGVQLSPVSGRQPAEPEGVKLSPVSGGTN
ncbi:hypothetical protein RRG08_038253 [Elysia crispata]|uniref:Uncharacterized protein n=1 Tax=Elysia crispata TaxID=231223 RepID=A0AAE1AMW3_9GAST|nr:hypothetical protein RRG08_038253 [Elysia crispata]